MPEDLTRLLLLDFEQIATTEQATLQEILDESIRMSPDQSFIDLTHELRILGQREQAISLQTSAWAITKLLVESPTEHEHERAFAAAYHGIFFANEIGSLLLGRCFVSPEIPEDREALLMRTGSFQDTHPTLASFADAFSYDLATMGDYEYVGVATTCLSFAAIEAELHAKQQLIRDFIYFEASLES